MTAGEPTVHHVRGASTVLDAAVFLLLVTAAVATLTASIAPVDDGPGAGRAAEIVATSTVAVTYSLAPGTRHADERLVTFPVESSPEFGRAAHGTHASLLAAAAVGNVTVRGTQLTHTYDGFERAVANATENATRRRVTVRAVWTPYRGAPVRGQASTGPQPPVDADVSAVTLTVDSDLPTVRGRARDAASEDGYAGVARVVARAVVRGLFPPNETRLALHGDYPVDALMEYRYRRAGRLLNASVAEAVVDAETERANRRLSQSLTAPFERDIRASFSTPEAAARAVRVGEVRVVVRRWSA